MKMEEGLSCWKKDGTYRKNEGEEEEKASILQ